MMLQNKNKHNFLYSVKKGLFKVMCLVLKHEQKNVPIAIVMAFVQCLQITYLNFGLKVEYVWQDNKLTDVISTLLKYFTITIAVNNVGITIYLTIFYICFGIIIISVILIFLLAFIVERKIIQQISINILRKLFLITLSFGFWPIVRMQMGYLACEINSDGISVMLYQKTEVCWTSEYSIHASIAIFGLIITFFYSIFTTSLVYESRQVYNGQVSMKNSRAYLTFLVYTFGQIMVYQLLEMPKYLPIIIIVFLIGSGVLFLQTHFDAPYYDNVLQRVWSTLTAINLWTIIMMTYASILQGNMLTSSVECWIIGIPLISGVIMIKQNNKIDLIVANVLNFTKGSQIVELCEYLQNLLLESEYNQRSLLLLDGFMQIHSELCNRNDCIVKIQNQLALKFKDNPLYQDKNVTISKLIIQIYQEGIKRFPEDIPLRLSHIYYQFNHQGNLALILSELTQAEEYKLAFDLEFQIYRYKQIIEEHLSSLTETFDIVAYTRQSKDLINNLEIVSLLVLDFWSSLTEEIPDLNQIIHLGFQIQKYRMEIINKWKKMSHKNAQKLIQYLSKYYFLIMNDTEESSKLQSYLQKIQGNKDQQLQELEDICNQSIPTLIASVQYEKVNIVTLNKAFCSLSGYSKADLLNRSINHLIPNIYHQPHNKSIDNYIEKKIKLNFEEKILSSQVFLLNKNNYITPVSIEIKLFQASNNQLYFATQYFYNFNPKLQCYLLVNNEGIIEHISSSCITILNLDNIKIQMKKLNIIEIIPDFFSKQTILYTKSGATLFITALTASHTNRSNETNPLIDGTEFQGYLQNIIFPSFSFQKSYGYILKLEKIQLNVSYLSTQKKKITNEIIPAFIFQNEEQVTNQNLVQGYYYLGYFNQTQLEESMNISQLDGASKFSRIVNQVVLIKKISEQTKIRSSNQLGEDIKTKRLINGQIMEIEDESIFLQQLEEEEAEQTRKKSEIEEMSEKEKDYYQQHYQLFQTKSVMRNIIQDAPVPKPLTIIKVLINVQFLIVFIAGLVTFIMNLNDDSNVINQIVQLSLSNRRLASYLQIQSIIQDMRFFNIDQLLGYESLISELIVQNDQLFTEEVSNLISIHNQLITKATTINPQYSQYETQYLASNIQLVSYNGNVSNYSYKEVIDQLISKAIILNASDITQFNDSNPDFFYFNYNSLNSITKNYQIPINYHYYAIRSVCENSLANKVILLIIQSTFQFIAYCLLAIYFTYYVSYIKDVYLNFFELSQKNIKQLILNCEHFLSLLQLGETDDDDENNEQEMQQILNQDNELQSVKQKKKKWKNTNNKMSKLMIVVLIIFLILEAYFIYQYISAEQVVSETYDLCPILNLTSLAEANYRFGDNALKEYFLHPNQSIFENSNPQTFIIDYFDIMYDLNADIMAQFSENIDLFSSNYIDTFQQIYITNPCQIVTQFQNIISEKDCNEILDESVQQGLSIGMTKYFENLQLLKHEFDQFDENNPIYTIISQAYNYSSDQKVNYGIAIQNSKISYETRVMQEIVIKYSQKYLVDNLKNSIDTNFSSLASIRIILFIIFMLYLFFIFFFIWTPVDRILRSNLNQSRKILLILPLTMILNTPQIRKYLRILMKH